MKDAQPNKFAEYVTSQKFCLTLTQAQVDALIWQMTHDPRYGPPYTTSLLSLERRGLIEHLGGEEWKTTVAGWKVYELIKIAGLVEGRDIFPREWQLDEHDMKLDEYFNRTSQ